MSNTKKRFTGIAWYERSDWQEIKRVVLDAYKLPESFDVWNTAEQHRIAELENAGFTVQKIDIEPEEFTTWCQFRGQAPTMTAILLFVAERIRPTPDARRIDGRRRGSQTTEADSEDVMEEAPMHEPQRDVTPGSSRPPAAPPQLSARERVAAIRPDLAMLFPTPV